MEGEAKRRSPDETGRNHSYQGLQAQRKELAKRLGTPSFSLFGFVVRNEAEVTRDVEVLVEFPSPPTFDQYMGLKLYLVSNADFALT